MAVPSRELKEKLELFKDYRGEEYECVLSYAYARFGRYQELIILEDVVDGVFEDLERGVRSLSSTTTRFDSLCGMVNSEVSHILERERRNVSLEAAQVKEQRPDPTEVAQLRQRRHASAEVTEAKERLRLEVWRIDWRLVCDAVKEMFKDDPVIPLMFSEWKGDASLKPRDLAKILGVDFGVIYDAHDRLMRKIRRNGCSDVQSSARSYNASRRHESRLVGAGAVLFVPRCGAKRHRADARGGGGR